MRFPQYDYTLVKYWSKKDIEKARNMLKKHEVLCLGNRLLINKTEEKIYEQLVRLPIFFRDKILNPINQALKIGLCHPAFKIKMKTIWSEVNRECNLKLKEMQKLKGDIDKVDDTQWTESLPDSDEMRNLTGEELSKLIQRWKYLSNYLMRLEAKYCAFETEWGRMKTRYFDKFKDAYRIVKIVQQNDDD